jgi:hypothetical protein
MVGSRVGSRVSPAIVVMVLNGGGGEWESGEDWREKAEVDGVMLMFASGSYGSPEKRGFLFLSLVRFLLSSPQNHLDSDEASLFRFIFMFTDPCHYIAVFWELLSPLFAFSLMHVEDQPFLSRVLSCTGRVEPWSSRPLHFTRFHWYLNHQGVIYMTALGSRSVCFRR